MKAKHFVSLIIFILIFFANKTLADSEYILLAAEKEGLYFRIGQAIAEIAKHADPPIYIKVEESSGSVDSLKRIEDGDADFALVQGDIVQSKYPDKKKLDSNTQFPKILTSLYTETVQICIRKSLHINEIKELKNKRVSLGPEGSGTEPNAVAVLGAAGITLAEIEESYFKFSEIEEEKYLADRRIDAAFFTAGAPHPIIEKLVGRNEAYLLGLDAHTIKRLVEENPYILSKIPKNTYPRMEENISTIGVAACLVCSDRVPDHVVRNLLSAIYEHKNIFKDYFPELPTIKMRDGVKGIKKDALHKEAIRFYEEEYVFRIQSFLNFMDKYYPFAILVILVILLFVYRINIAKMLNRKEFTRNFGIIFIGVLCVLFPTGVALFYLERSVNECFGTLGESIWSIIVFLFSGFEDRAPITSLGRIVSIVGIVGGIIIGSFFTGVIAAIRVKGVMMLKKRLGKVYKNHVVILGWNKKGKGALNEILKWGKYVAVLCEEDKSKIEESVDQKRAHQVTIINGIPYLEEKLNELKLKEAHSILILATKSDQHSADDMTMIITMNLRKLLDEMKMKKRRPRIVAEVVDPDMKESIKTAGADEVVCTSDLGQNLLVNCTVTPGVSLFFEDLLRMDSKTNEIYLTDVPSQFDEDTYDNFCNSLADNIRSDDPLIPLGIKRPEENIKTNPKDPNKKILAKGDKVLIMAYSRSSLKLLNNLKGIKKS